MKNKIGYLSNKFYDRTKKAGIISALLLGEKFIDYKFRVAKREFLLPLELKFRLYKRKEEIRNGLKTEAIKNQTLQFIENMRFKDTPYGIYKYSPCQTTPVLYASLYAAMTRHLYNDFADLTIQEKNEWVQYIKSYQCDDGWFRDPEIKCDLAESADWWGWKHMTFHAIMALSCLDAIADKKFSVLESFKDNKYIEKWFKNLHIKKIPSSETNAHLPLYMITLLQYARDNQTAIWANSAIEKVIGLLNSEIDPNTGCWCTGNGQKKLVNEGVKIAYHFWIFYFYDKLPIMFPERVIDSVLSTQNPYGGFNYNINSSACDDIDSIDPLCRLKNSTDYKKEEIEASLNRSIPWILANMNDDGGFVFQRGRGFTYGHRKMYSGYNESNMFATWFRTLSLSYIGKALPSSFLGKYQWNIRSFPGLQFWNEDEKLKK